MLFILDPQQTVVGTLDNETPNGLPFFNDVLSETLDNGGVLYSFETLGDHEDSKLLIPEGCILKKRAGSDDFHVLKIKEIAQENREGKQILKVELEALSISELLASVMRPRQFTNENVDTIIDVILRDTGWSVGNVEQIDIKRDVNISRHMSTLAAIYEAISPFETEVEFIAKMDDENIVTKHVNLKTQRGNRQVSFRFSYEQNMLGVTKTTDSRNIVTGLIGVGRADESGVFLGLNQISSEASVSEILDDDDVLLVGDALVSKSAFEQYGINGKHILNVFEDNNALTPLELLKNTYGKLRKRIRPRVTYVIDVANLNYSEKTKFIGLGLGDRISISDVSFNPPLHVEGRIISLKSSEANPQSSVVTLGDYVRSYGENDARIERLQQLIREKEAAWNASRELAEEAMNKVEDTNDRLTDIESENSQIREDMNDLAREEDLRNVENEVQENLDEMEDYFDDRINEVQNENQSAIGEEASQREEQANSITKSFVKAGGVNLLKNSIGLARFESWQVGGNVRTSTFETSEVGRTNGFNFYSDANSFMRQTLRLTIGETYTLSWLLRKNSIGNFVVNVLSGSQNTVVSSISYEDETFSEFQLMSLTFRVLHNPIVIEFSSLGDPRVELTNVMLNIGTYPFSWSPHPLEFHTGYVHLDINGIRVENSGHDGYTVMSAHEFAGYHQQEGVAPTRIFGIDKDSFIMNKAKVENGIKMGGLQLISLANEKHAGWAFVANQD